MAGAIAGFSVDINLVKAYHALNKDKKELYLVTKYSDDGKKLILDEKGPVKPKAAKTYADKNKHWQDLAAKLPESEIRYVPIQVDFKDSKGANRNDILLMIWALDSVPIMQKMEIDKHKAIILKCFAGVREAITINNRDEWSVEKIVKDKLKGSLD